MPPTKTEQLLEMLKSEPNDSFLNYALALEYAKANDINKAINLLEEIIKRDSLYLGAYYQLGKYYEETGNIPKAKDVYTKGVLIAKQQNNRKTIGELNEVLMMLEE